MIGNAEEKKNEKSMNVNQKPHININETISLQQLNHHKLLCWNSLLVTLQAAV